MSKMTQSKKERLGLIPEKKQMTRDDLLELQQLHYIVTSQQFKVAQIQANTALFPHKEFVQAEEALARLFADTETNWVANKLAELGYQPHEKVTVDYSTGEITLI